MEEDRGAEAEDEAGPDRMRPGAGAREEPSGRAEDERPARRRDRAAPVGIDEIVRRPVSEGGREPP